MHWPMPHNLNGTRSSSRHAARRGFTLVELLVVMIIIVTLASLVLVGLSAAQERTREEQTRGTVAKINGEIMLMMDEYRTRRVQAPPVADKLTAAANRLLLLRAYQRQEMPDTYADLAGGTVAGVAIPDSPLLSIATFLSGSIAVAAQQNESAECLYLTVFYGMNADDQVKFLGREVGDTDNDGVPEFHDGWGNPIGWLRWAPGFIEPSSEIQHDPTDPDEFHPDPFDPLGVDKDESVPRGYRLYPLIVAPGPDGVFGIFPLDDPGAFAASGDPYDVYGGLRRGELYLNTVAAAAGGSSGDNIHNHSLGVK